ncbi:MAG: amylo-alpha-1,6-glucosidase [Bacteroidales bacterium]|nr:amylo-alpha-1,6-glucosidase [Bacteroidales bacterium]
MKIRNSPGLFIEFLENGAIKSIEASPIRISLKPATLFSSHGANLFLRKRSQAIEYKSLTGPLSNSRFVVHDNAYYAQGSWNNIDYQVVMQFSDKSLSWQYSVEISNHSDDTVELDLICVQDVGLKQATDGLINEYYVSQYLERRILEDDRFGPVVCCRQNMRESTGHPWLMAVCMNGAQSAATDGMLFYGRTCRVTGIPEGLITGRLGGEYAGESSVIALQEKPFQLAASGHHRSVFIFTYLPDHPQATSAADLGRLAGLLSEFCDVIALSVTNHWVTPVGNLFNTSSFLPVDDLHEEELIRFFGTDRRHCEWNGERLLSFFCRQNEHVVLQVKETLVDRPHAHIMQTGAGLLPDESIMSTTSFASGIFNSHLSQGNTNFNVLLSICTSQFNLGREAGQRIFVEIGGRYYLLGVPSAFEMDLNHCRWVYKHGDHCFQIRTWTSKSIPQVNMDFKVISGPKVKLLVTHDFNPLNGWVVQPGRTTHEWEAKPKTDSMIRSHFPHAAFRMVIHDPHVQMDNGGEQILFADQKNHGSSLWIILTEETSDLCMSFIGDVCGVNPYEIIQDPDQKWSSDCEAARSAWQVLSLNLSLKSSQSDIKAIHEILPWYGMNALTHFLTPYGLEQFSGAAWGTRDVAQGPVDLLLTMGKYREAKQVLKIIFSNQHPDGGWPQWWMFDSYQSIRADSSHGDIYYWCIIALANYIKITGDLDILGEPLPYYRDNNAELSLIEPLSEHMDRLIQMIIHSFIPGTSLVPFDGGDWNDSLQPVSKELAQRMISSWTVEMNYQAFGAYEHVYALTGNKAKAEEMHDICMRIKADFNQHLIKAGIVAGYGLVEEDQHISVLLHPEDYTTGIHYSILPMERGILSGIFSREQALYHQDLIEKHLKGPDGARLMDRPLKYKGGIQDIFQRAESSTHFGREIGLMYVHEHIRYAESLAITGRADAFVKALRQAIPVGYREIVPCGDIRQANCYYSSSDVIFRNRYEADVRYDEIRTGNLTLRGGWRVYSSGPGIYISLIITRLLGLRIQNGYVIIDPVIPFSMDGLAASLNLLGHSVTFNYSVRNGKFSPTSISINGESIPFTLEENKYRLGGAVIPRDRFMGMLDPGTNVIHIRL